MIKTKIVSGAISNGKTALTADITIRATKDSRGGTLSLSNDKDIMLIVPVEPIKGLLEWLSREGQG